MSSADFRDTSSFLLVRCHEIIPRFRAVPARLSARCIAIFHRLPQFLRHLLSPRVVLLYPSVNADIWLSRIAKPQNFSTFLIAHFFALLTAALADFTAMSSRPVRANVRFATLDQRFFLRNVFAFFVKRDASEGNHGIVKHSVQWR